MNPTTQQPTYELLKDILTYKAGEKFILDAELGCYIAEKKDSFGKRATWHTVYVEGLPDWFRRVEVKDWELVSVTVMYNHPEMKDTVWEKINGMFRVKFKDEVALTDEQILKNDCIKINSVRRLSDGETFTIGETIFYDKGNPKIKHTWVIDNFFIRASDGVLLVRGKDNINVEQVDKFISKLPPSPPVEQETIKVENLQYYGEQVVPSKKMLYRYNFNLTVPEIPSEKYDAVKKAIEFVLRSNDHPLKRSDGMNLWTQEDVIGLLRDAVSSTWGNQSIDRTQEKFDKFLLDRKLVEPTLKDINTTVSRLVNEILLDKKYTEEELLEAQQNAFYAGTKRDFNEKIGTVEYTDGDCGELYRFKYTTFSDYIQSLKK